MENLFLNKRKAYLFSFWFSISFILNGYATGISGISLGSFCMFVIVILAILNKPNTLRSPIPTMPVFYSFLFISVIAFITNGLSFNIPTVIVDISKYLLWALFAAIVIPVFYEKKIFILWLKRISFLLTTYLIIQTIAYYIYGIFLPNIFNYGPLIPYDEGYADYSWIDNISFLRPASFLSEPSFYGNYALFTLCIILNDIKDNFSKYNVFLSLYLSIGIILSSSTSAIILLMFVWIVLGWNIIKKYKFISMISFMIIGLGISVTIRNFNKLESSESKTDTAIFQTFDKFSRVDKNRRLGSSFSYIDKLNSNELLFGVGIGCDKVKFKTEYESGHLYMNSATLLLVQLGYLGSLVFLIFIIIVFIKCIRYRNKLAFTLLSIYIIKAFASGILFNTYGIMLIAILAGTLYDNQINNKLR